MRRIIPAAAAAVLLAAPPAVRAQNFDLDSSMSAVCLLSSCEVVQFILEVPNAVYVDIVRLFADGASPWRFGSVLEIVDGGGNIVTTSFFRTIYSDQRTLAIGAALPPFLFAEPFSLTVQMAAFGSDASSLYPAVTYSADGETDPVFDGDGFFTTRGNVNQPPAVVTPEPSTVVLLGTGLAGVLGMAWRRRGEDETGF